MIQTSEWGEKPCSVGTPGPPMFVCCYLIENNFCPLRSLSGASSSLSLSACPLPLTCRSFGLIFCLPSRDPKIFVSSCHFDFSHGAALLLPPLSDTLPSDPLQSQYDSWLSLVDHLNIKAFVNLTLADSVRHGIQHLLFISGLGQWRHRHVLCFRYSSF